MTREKIDALDFQTVLCWLKTRSSATRTRNFAIHAVGNGRSTVTLKEKKYREYLSFAEAANACINYRSLAANSPLDFNLDDVQWLVDWATEDHRHQVNVFWDVRKDQKKGLRIHATWFTGHHLVQNAAQLMNVKRREAESDNFTDLANFLRVEEIHDL